MVCGPQGGACGIGILPMACYHSVSLWDGNLVIRFIEAQVVKAAAAVPGAIVKTARVVGMDGAVFARIQSWTTRSRT